MLSVQGDFPDGVVLSSWLSDGEAQVGSVRRPAGPGYSSASTQQEFRRASILSGKKQAVARDRKSTRLNSSHVAISYAVFCLKKKTKTKACERDETKAKAPATSRVRTTV